MEYPGDEGMQNKNSPTLSLSLLELHITVWNRIGHMTSFGPEKNPMQMSWLHTECAASSFTYVIPAKVWYREVAWSICWTLQDIR